MKKSLPPEERVKARARAQAELLLAEARAEGQELKFPTTEKDWIENYVKANAQMWRDSVVESEKRARVPMLRWVGSEWKLMYDWEEPPQWGWGSVRSRVE